MKEGSPEMSRRGFLEGLAAFGAASTIPEIADAQSKSEKKEAPPKTQYLDFLMENVAGKFKLSDGELQELANSNAWKLREKLINYQSVLNTIAEMYPKAPDYKGKNPAQEALEQLKARAKELGLKL